jgi:hypothetical protein
MNRDERSKTRAFVVEQQTKFFAGIEELEAAAQLGRNKQVNAASKELRFDGVGRRVGRLGLLVVGQRRKKRRERTATLTGKANALIGVLTCRAQAQA